LEINNQLNCGRILHQINFHYRLTVKIGQDSKK